MGRGIQFDEVQFHPRRAMLVRHSPDDDPLSSVSATLEKRDPGIEDRAARNITGPQPFHLSAENTFVLQLEGKQKAYVWDPADREVVSERCLEVFCAQGSKELLVLRSDFTKRAVECELEAGTGVYVPALAPYLLAGGGTALVITYSTRATREAVVLYRGNHALRQLGLAPHAIGDSSVSGRLRDRVKLAAARFLAGRG